jgi:hypothetical protein
MDCTSDVVLQNYCGKPYLSCYGRPATKAEIEAAVTFVNDYRDRGVKAKKTARVAESDAWTAFCQALWASGEFLSRR